MVTGFAVVAVIAAVASFGFAVRFPMIAVAAVVAVVAAVASFGFAVVTVTASIMTILGFLNALGPSFFSVLNLGAGFGFLFFAHVVPAVSQGGGRAFPVGGSAGARFWFAVVAVTFPTMTRPGFLHSLLPCRLHALSSFGLLLFAHVVPAVSQGG